VLFSSGVSATGGCLIAFDAARPLSVFRCFVGVDGAALTLSGAALGHEIEGCCADAEDGDQWGDGKLVVVARTM